MIVLAALAADLVQRQVAVIAPQHSCRPGLPKAATSTVRSCLKSGAADPVQRSRREPAQPAGR